MAWLRIDDGFPEHRKILMLKRPDRWTWMELMCYCARQNDMGQVPQGINDILRNVTPAFLRKCVDAGLLDDDNGELRVHDWHDYNPKDPTGPARQMRYRNRHRNAEVTETVTEPTVTEVTPRARASRPVPSPKPNNPKAFDLDVGGTGDPRPIRAAEENQDGPVGGPGEDHGSVVPLERAQPEGLEQADVSHVRAVIQEQFGTG